MRKRLLRYAMASNGPLFRDNEAHKRAHNSAYHIYNANAVYNLVPKNACTTMRLSIAIDNGCIPDQSGINWVHHNNGLFKPSLRELLQADYTFVILRCPYARLASCFLDQFMRPTDAVKTILSVSGGGQGADSITFKSFCRCLSDPGIRVANIHWQPQRDFMVYDTFDDYFSIETFKEDSKTILKKTGMEIVDARPLSRHGLDQVELLSASEQATDIPLSHHRVLRKAGKACHPASLYDDESRRLIANAYAEDIKLFDELFPGRDLFALSGV